MKSSLFIKLAILLLVFLGACQTRTPTAIPSPIATATSTSSPIPTSNIEIIDPENANHLTLKWMNMGRVYENPIYSPDGKSLYITSTVGTYAFDTDSYQEIHSLETVPIATPTPNAQTFSGLELLPGLTTQPNLQNIIHSPDGSLIAGQKYPEFSAVWRLADGKLINQFEGSPEEISPDNRLIVIGGSTNDRFYRDLYDLQTGKQLGSWFSIRAFFLSDNRLAVESGGYTRIFDPMTRKVPHAFPGEYASFSSDGQNVAVLYGRQIHIYRVADGKLLQKLDGELPITHFAILRFSANGQVLAAYTKQYACCATEMSFLNLWRVTDGKRLVNLSQDASQFFSLSPDGQAIALGLKILRTSDGSLIKDLKTYFIPPVTNLAFTSDGQKIIVLDNNGQVHLYSVESEILSLPQDADRETYLPILQPASGLSSEDVMEVTSPDGKLLARRNMGIVTISSISNAEEPIQIPVAQVMCFTFSPDGRIIALGLRNGSVELWNPDSKQKIYTLPARTNDNSNYVSGLAFSPDGKLLVIGMIDGTVRLYGLSAK